MNFNFNSFACSLLAFFIDNKRKIAYIPDNPDLYEALTGIQYLNFIGDVFKVNKEVRKEITIK